MVEHICNRKTKQDFLISEIKCQGYDLDHFTQYMLSLKDDGSNIDNWSMKELNEAVVNYRCLPHLIFKQNQTHFQNILDIEEISSLNFKITVKHNETVLYRTYKQIEDTIEKLILENPHVYFIKPVKAKQVVDIKTNRILKEHLDSLKISLEHLYANKHILSSKLCNAFFNESFEAYDITLSSYNPVRSVLGNVYKSFNAAYFKKVGNVPDIVQYPLLSDNTKFQENIESYTKYIEKYLDKSETIWQKYSTLMNQLQANIKATSDTYLKLSEVTVELFHQIDKLHSVIQYKEEGLKKSFIEINKALYNNSKLNRY